MTVMTVSRTSSFLLVAAFDVRSIQQRLADVDAVCLLFAMHLQTIGVRLVHTVPHLEPLPGSCETRLVVPISDLFFF